MSEPAHSPIALLVRTAAMLASDEGAGVDYVEVRLRAADAGPTRSELEAVLGSADELPRIPGPAFHRLSFPGPQAGVHVSLFADIDDDTGRATSLLARRDELG